METLITIAVLCALCVGMLGLAMAVLIVRDRFSDARSRARWEELSREHPERVPGTADFRARLGRPQFDAVQSLVAGRLPTSYVTLYTTDPLVYEAEFDLLPPQPRGAWDRWEILHFLPADRE